MSTEVIEVNGIKVVNIHNSSENALFGIAVQAGSNYETPKIAGVSHFAEHMFFKGTEKRNWSDINMEFAKLGVNNNAYTSTNEVFYHTTCPKENVEPVIDLMLDMLFNSTIPEEELEKERGVISEEKKMYADDPFYAFDSEIGKELFVWEKGHDTIGEFETINSITRDDLVGFLKDKTNLKNLMFVCCGDIKTEDLRAYIEKRVPATHAYLTEGEKNTVSNGFFNEDINYDDKIQLVYERESLTQSQLTMMVKGYAINDPKYDASRVVLAGLGGGMYSKLFSRLREELGLCYSVSMSNFPVAYPDHTLTRLYSFVSPENVELFMGESEKIITDMVKNGLDKDLFECAKTDLLGHILRATETSAGKAQFLVKRYLFTDSEKTFEESMDELRSIKIEDCNNIIEEMFNAKYVWALMNPKGE
jgi:predicted Zn-dependent peptidase